MNEHAVRRVETDVLRIAYVERGPTNGWPVILSHGFPYDVHSFDEVASILARAGARAIAPCTRGFRPTRFVSDDVGLERPFLGGFDWGGNASCVAATLWPERIGGLVSYAGYDVIDVSRQRHAVAPSLERVFWYQHLFQTERGRECLKEHRRDLCRMLWSDWSPGWQFDEATFAQSAVAFDNPDFVEVVIHCYRSSFGLEPGDPALQPLEDRLVQKPPVKVPTVTIDGATDPLKPGGTAEHAGMFVGLHEHRVVDAGHNLPQEARQPFANAVIKVRDWFLLERHTDDRLRER
jgi:pimeloyl-ACP methyl ester carboxylesterase